MLCHIEKFLEAVLSSSEFNCFYSHLLKRHPELQNFPTYSDLLDFLHDSENQDYHTKDYLLEILIYEYKYSQGELLATFFLVIFYPGMAKIVLENKTFFLNDFEEIWSEIRADLLDVISKYDPANKPSKIAATILGRVKNRIRDIKQKIHIGDKTVDIEEIPEVKEDTSFNKSFLNLLVNQNIITQKDKNLLMETRINNEPVRELALKKKIPFETVRKRRQRAEKKIHKFLVEQRKRFASELGKDEKNIYFTQVVEWLRNKQKKT